MTFRLCVSRPPRDEEMTALAEFHARQKQRFEAGQSDPTRVAGKASDGKNMVELATWTTIARALLNLDETITRE